MGRAGAAGTASEGALPPLDDRIESISSLIIRYDSIYDDVLRHFRLLYLSSQFSLNVTILLPLVPHFHSSLTLSLIHI